MPCYYSRSIVRLDEGSVGEVRDVSTGPDGIRGDAGKLRRSLAALPEPVARPVFIVVSGLPGSGKSHLCRALAKRLSSIILESDAMRRVLFETPTYSAAENRRLFPALHSVARWLLRHGRSVILDATNLTESSRRYLYRIAEEAGATLLLVRVRAPVSVIRERLARRAAVSNGQDHSEANWEVYERLEATAEKIGRRHFAVDTSRDIEPAIEKIVRAAGLTEG